MAKKLLIKDDFIFQDTGVGTIQLILENATEKEAKELMTKILEDQEKVDRLQTTLMHATKHWVDKHYPRESIIKELNSILENK